MCSVAGRVLSYEEVNNEIGLALLPKLTRFSPYDIRMRSARACASGHGWNGKSEHRRGAIGRPVFAGYADRATHPHVAAFREPGAVPARPTGPLDVLPWSAAFHSRAVFPADPCPR